MPKNQVHPDNLQALHTLAGLVDVHILSYVATKPRAHAFYKQVEELVLLDTLRKVKSTMVVWTKCGAEGKSAGWGMKHCLMISQTSSVKRMNGAW